MKKKYGKVEPDAFWRRFHHLIPYVDEFLPEQHKKLPRKEYVNRFVQRGHKLNYYENEHPTHPTKQNSTGRFWGWAQELYNSPAVEFTIRKEQLEEIISKIEGRLPMMPEPKELEEPEEFVEVIDLNQIIESVEHLETIVEDLRERTMALEQYFKRRVTD